MAETSPPGVRLAAAKALFPILGCISSIAFVFQGEELVQAILRGCDPSGPQELAIAAFQCLGRLACELHGLMDSHAEQVAPVALEAVRRGSAPVATVALEVWRAFATWEQSSSGP